MIEKAEEYIWANARVLEQRRFELLFKGGAKAARHRRRQALQDARRRLRVRAGARRARPDEPAAAHLDRAGGARGRRHHGRRRLRSPRDHDRARRRRPRRPPLIGAVSACALVADRHRGKPARDEPALRAARPTRRRPRLAGTRGVVLLGHDRRDREDAPVRRRGRALIPRRRARPGPRRASGRSGSETSSRSRTSSARSPRATPRARSTTRIDFARRPDSLARPWFTDDEIDDSLDQLASTAARRRRLADHVGRVAARDRVRVERDRDDRRAEDAAGLRADVTSPRRAPGSRRPRRSSRAPCRCRRGLRACRSASSASSRRPRPAAPASSGAA